MNKISLGFKDLPKKSIVPSRRHKRFGILENLENASGSFTQIAKAYRQVPGALHNISASLHNLCGAIALAEYGGCSRESILKSLRPAREKHGEAILLRRLQEWPRGYPGDFETIEALMNQRPLSERETFAWHLETIALASPIVQQHRNKVLAQSREISHTLDSNSDCQKILVLACGGSQDLESNIAKISNKACTIVINDADADALKASFVRLNRVENKLKVIPGNALLNLNRFAEYGPYDLVLAGGLFDYLPDKHASMLIKKIFSKLLRENGKFFFTNIKEGNPFRVWMEYLVNWKLIERTEQDLRCLIEAACGSEVNFEIETDLTDLTYLISVNR